MEVFTFGNGDFLFQIFTAVKGIMGDGSFSTLIRISVLLGFLILLYKLFFSMNVATFSLGFIKHYIFIIIIFYALFVPKVDIVIRDEIHNTNVAVNQVPYGIGLMAHLFTTAEKNITELMETYFTTPNDMKFNNTGFAFSVMVLDTLKSATPVDPYFKRTLNDYIVNCFFTDVLWGDKDLNQIIYSNNLFADMNPEYSAGSYTKVYSSGSPQGTATSCSSAYSTIQSQFGSAASDSLDKLNETMQVDVTAALPTVTTTLLNVGGSATSLISQAIAANALKTGLAETAMYTGVSADAIAYATALAEQQQRSAWVTAGELSKKYLPIVRQILESFVYGMFPILFIMMMTPIGPKALQMYFILLLWLLLWSPLFSILNLIVNTRATGVLSPAFGYFSLGTMPYIYESTNDLTAMAGYMAWLVPVLAFAIAKGSDYAIVSLASGVAQSTNLQTVHAASAVTGPEGSQRAASAAGHFMGRDTYGADALSMGYAAQKFYSIGSGVKFAGHGMDGITQTAMTKIDRDVGSQKGFVEGTRAAGVADVTSSSAIISNIATQKNIGGAKASEGVATVFGFRNVADLEQAVQTVQQSQRAGSASAVGSFASELQNKFDLSRQGAYELMGEVGIQSNRAALNAFKGDAKAYGKFMERNLNLSWGQQQGIMLAAEAANVDLSNFGQQTAFVENMQKVGALDALNKGYLNENDLRNIGFVTKMRAAGDANAAGIIQSVTDMNPKEQSEYLKSREFMNELAKFQVREGMAKTLGKGGDLKGLYNYLKQSHGIDTVALDAPMADALNKNMQEAGYKNFKASAGNNVSFAYDSSSGKIGMVHSTGGGKSEQYDLDVKQMGWIRDTKAISTSESGYRNQEYAINTRESGRRNIEYNANTFQGVTTVRDPNTGNPTAVYGTFQKDDYGNVISAELTNLQSGEIFTAQKVNDRGTEQWQYGVENYQMGPNGRKVYQFKSLSSRDVETGGYASHQVMGTSGTSLYEKADAGQQVNWWHQFKMNFEKGANVSAFGVIAPLGSDLTNLNSWQTNAIYLGGSTQKAIDTALKIDSLRSAYSRGRSNTSPQLSPQKAPDTVENARPTLYGPDGKPIN